MGGIKGKLLRYFLISGFGHVLKYAPFNLNLNA